MNNLGSCSLPRLRQLRRLVKNMSVMVVLSKTNVRGVNSHLTLEMALKLQLSTFHFDPFLFLFLRPSKSME